MDESSRKLRPERGSEGQPQDGEAAAFPRMIAPVMSRGRTALPTVEVADKVELPPKEQPAARKEHLADPAVVDVMRALHRVLSEESLRVAQASSPVPAAADTPQIGDGTETSAGPRDPQPTREPRSGPAHAVSPEPSVADVLRELHAATIVDPPTEAPTLSSQVAAWPTPSVADVLGELHKASTGEPAPAAPPNVVHATWPEPSVADVLAELHEKDAGEGAPVLPPSAILSAWPEPSVADVLADLHHTAVVAQAHALPLNPLLVAWPEPSVADVLVALHAARSAPRGDPGPQRAARSSIAARIPTIQTTPPGAGRSTTPSAVSPPDVARADTPPIETREPPAASEPPLPPEPKPSEPEDLRARIIPFVPRSPRPDAPRPPPTVAEVYAKPAVPFFARSDEAPQPRPSLPPAQPPPPDGYRGSAVPRSLNAAQELAPDSRREGLDRVPAWWQEIAWGRVVRGTAKWLGILLVAYVTLVLTLVVAYRWIDPPLSSLMLSQRLSGNAVTQRWVSLERISPNLQHAVILSEDGQFCRHRGVDWGELKEAIEQSLDGSVRGGSTISMQLVKNLFLWSSKSYIRKAIEIPLALLVERVWPKARVLEIYLNIAEWGPGIFGAEAAARYHFGKSAANLSVREASLLAVSLPNPIERQAGRPGIGTQRLADTLQGRMRRTASVAACGRSAKGTALGAADRR